MTTTNKNKGLYKLLLVLAAVLAICIYSCNSSGSTEKKDTAAPGTNDTSMKMSTDTTKMMDTTKKDTSGKGGQPTPTGH